MFIIVVVTLTLMKFVNGEADIDVRDSSNVRLCRGSSMSPFVVGDFLSEKTVSRLTIFDVEILHGMEGLGSWKRHQKDSEKDPISLVNALVFLESAGSITYSQWHSWGVGLVSSSAENLDLTCNYHLGLNPSARADAPFWKGKAVVVHSGLYLNIHCPLPQNKEDAALLQNIESYQIHLKLANTENQILHLDPLPICRDRGIQPTPKLSGSESVELDLKSLRAEELNTELQNRRRTHRKLIHPHHKPLKYGGGNGGNGKDDNIKQSVRVLPKSNVSVSICIRAYHDHNLFESRSTTHSPERLHEFIDYHLMLGVNRVYFYDRFGTEMLETLQPYVDRGQVVHIPFPEWSEVYYRKEWFQGKAKDPYNFPMIYDQVLNYEACLMEGRRNQEDWMLFVDTDEFFWTPAQEVGKLPYVLDNIRREHEEKQRDVPLAAVVVHRVNFLGADNDGSVVLKSSKERCEGQLVDVFTEEDGKISEVRSKAKIAARPQHMLGAKVEVHRVEGKRKEQLFVPALSEVRFNHYKSASKKQLFGMKPEECQQIDDPLKVTSKTLIDESMFWAADLLQLCTRSEASNAFKAGECGNLL